MEFLIIAGDQETLGFADSVILGWTVAHMVFEVSNWRTITVSNLGRKCREQNKKERTSVLSPFLRKS